MRGFLLVLFGAILAAMLWVTTAASLHMGVFEAGAQLWPDPWFRATLADAYFGFITVFVWIAWRERGTAARMVWFVLLMGLGNIAIAGYVLIQLARLEPGQTVSALFERRAPPAAPRVEAAA